jgi:hypothetical protein
VQVFGPRGKYYPDENGTPQLQKATYTTDGDRELLFKEFEQFNETPAAATVTLPVNPNLSYGFFHIPTASIGAATVDVSGSASYSPINYVGVSPTKVTAEPATDGSGDYVLTFSASGAGFHYIIVGESS